MAVGASGFLWISVQKEKRGHPIFKWQSISFWIEQKGKRTHGHGQQCADCRGEGV